MYSHTDFKKNNTVLNQEKAVLDRVLKNKRGNDLLQIGGPSDGRLIENARVARKFFVDQHFHPQCKMPFIQAHSDCLPIQSEAIDIIVMMHQLESARSPMDVLQEAHRVLRPNGQLIIFGFNRWSVWQLCHRQEKTCSAGKIKRRLRALDFEITAHQTLCFWPPSLLLETLGQFFLPYAGSVFMLVAQKNIPGMTPLIINNYRSARACEMK